MSYQVYKVMHLFGVLTLLFTLGSAYLLSAFDINIIKKHKKAINIVHGVSLMVALTGGFGLLARIGIKGGFPGWVWVKIIIWLLFGAATAILFKKPQARKAMYLVIPALSFAAIFMAVYKPF